MTDSVKKYIKVFVVIFLIASFGNEIYTQINKPKSAKSTRLQCHKEGVTFEKIVNQELIRTLKYSLNYSHFSVIVWADKAKYMESVMFDYVDVKAIKNNMINKIKQYAQKRSLTPDNIKIEVIVYENDKKDPGKKTKKSKLYAGYLKVTVKVNSQIAYMIQTDFMDLEGKDIPQRITCIVKSIMSLKE